MRSDQGKKRTLHRLIAVIAALLTAVVTGSTAAYAWNGDARYQSLTISNVPEGTTVGVTWDIDHSFHVVTVDIDKAPEKTAFADVLIKDKWHDKYAVDFNVENAGLLGVGRDCGLAAYDTDGYTSLLLRHNCAKSDYSLYGSIFYSLIREKLYDRYRTVRVAYCDKDGDILGVTDEVKVERASYDKAVYSFKADGESLSCSVSKLTEQHFPISIVILMLILLGVLLLTAVKLIKKAQTAKMIKRIQSGETDNERKE